MLKKYLTLRTDDIYGWREFALVFRGLFELESNEAFSLLAQRCITYTLYLCDRYRARCEIADVGNSRLKASLVDIAETLGIQASSIDLETKQDSLIWNERATEWKNSESEYLKHCEWIVYETEIRYKRGVEIEMERLRISE